jgi:hypothetical protein
MQQSRPNRREDEDDGRSIDARVIDDDDSHNMEFFGILGKKSGT